MYIFTVLLYLFNAHHMHIYCTEYTYLHYYMYKLTELHAQNYIYTLITVHLV